MVCCGGAFQIQGHPAFEEQFLSPGQWAPCPLSSAICTDVAVSLLSSRGPVHLTLSPPNSEKSPRSVPYHYFEKGRLDECQMYRLHEQAPRSAHRFITEKAVFSRWAKKRPIVFAHPSWRAK